MEVKFCDGCRHLNPPENHPHTTLHWCLMTDKQVYHHGFHPLIKRPDWCPISIELDTIAALRAEVADYKQTFDLIHKAEVRGVEMFRETHPEYAEKLAHPSTDKLICWLVEKLAAMESRDEVWRAKKDMLENDLAKAWEQLAHYRELVKKLADVKHEPDKLLCLLEREAIKAVEDSPKVTESGTGEE